MADSSLASRPDAEAQPTNARFAGLVAARRSRAHRSVPLVEAAARSGSAIGGLSIALSAHADGQICQWVNPFWPLFAHDSLQTLQPHVKPEMP
jgi:hypothetical protein